MIIKYSTYIKESDDIAFIQPVEAKYKNGDIVYFLSEFTITSEFNGENKVIDVLRDVNGSYWYTLDKGKGKTIRWIPEHTLFKNEDDVEEEIKRRELEKIIRKNEEKSKIREKEEANWEKKKYALHMALQEENNLLYHLPLDISKAVTQFV